MAPRFFGHLLHTIEHLLHPVHRNAARGQSFGEARVRLSAAGANAAMYIGGCGFCTGLGLMFDVGSV